MTAALLAQRVSRREGEGRIGRQCHTPDAALYRRPGVYQRLFIVIVVIIIDVTQTTTHKHNSTTDLLFARGLFIIIIDVTQTIT